MAVIQHKTGGKAMATETKPTAAHTPGPWVVEQDATRVGDRWKITAPTPKPGRRYTVTVVVNHDVADRPIAEADARLIAAAPDLLAVLRRAADYVENEHYERMCGDGQEPGDGDPICTCYDEVDGAPDGPPPGRCLPCQIRAAISSATP